MMLLQDSELEGGKAATPQGHALDRRPKGCYTPGSDGGSTRKSVPEFVAVGEHLTTSLWAPVKGGGNCRYPNGKRHDFLATNVTKKLDHYKKEDLSQIIYEVVNRKAAKSTDKDKRAPKPRTRKKREQSAT